MYKKKKNNSIWIILIIILLAIGAGFGYWRYTSIKSQAESQTGEVLPDLEDGQEYLYVMINSILGNEMTGTVYEDNKSTGLEKTWLIPVGTDVVTKLGTTTSFSRLANGDYIRILVQDSPDTQEILKIWIVN